MTMPTCPGACGVPSLPAKNTRSPGCAAGGAVGHHGQAGAVVGVRAGAAPLVGLAELGLGVGDDRAGGPGGQRPGGASWQSGLLAAGIAWVAVRLRTAQLPSPCPYCLRPGVESPSASLNDLRRVRWVIPLG